MAHVFGEGGRSDDHGGAMLPQMLRWIWRDYPGVVAPTNDLIAEAAAIKPESSELFPGFDKVAQVDPTGTNTWERRFGDTTFTILLKIQLLNDKLSRTFETQLSDAPPTIVNLKEPILEGNKLTFDVATSFRDREVMSTYQGIVSDRRITGWLLTDFDGQPRDSSWTT